ncbi:PqqD family protein [Listeria booriae]|uniref:PqqD family protein n=1 Tax=Listeria booriae TaxID=1552123 RepID=A0A842A1B3_9LIST|nr:PqqD family protein [Listeria booriae]MBC1573861.1 PqqD family protein [Listeria booriae]MBC2206323.1 PqqD family protein [Listeria booriae]MBC2242947.1 PqqD family protein [Listeria booriae]
MKKKERRNMLEEIPNLKDNLKLEVVEKEKFLIVPRSAWLERVAIKVLKQPAVRRIKLDEHGYFILTQMDGKTTIPEMEERFSRTFGNEDGMSLARLVRFLQVMDSYSWLKWERE